MPSSDVVRRALEVFADSDGKIDRSLLQSILVHDYTNGKGQRSALTESEAGRAVSRLLQGSNGDLLCIDDISRTWASQPARRTKPATPYDHWQKQSAFRRSAPPDVAAAHAVAAAATRRAAEQANAARVAAEARAAAEAEAEAEAKAFALKIAIHSADPAAVRLALSNGADANAAEPLASSVGDDTDFSDDVSGGEFPLVWCARAPSGAVDLGAPSPSVQIVQMLLDARADPLQQLPEGESAAYVFASRGRAELLAPLVAAGASLETAERSMGETPLLAASRHGLAPTVAELLRLGANPATPGGARETPLWIASRRGHLAVVEALLMAGAEVDTPDEVGETPLLKAAEFGHLPVLRALLAAGADPSVEALHGGTALAAARAAGSKLEQEQFGGTHHGGKCEECAALLRARMEASSRPLVRDVEGSVRHGVKV